MAKLRSCRVVLAKDDLCDANPVGRPHGLRIERDGSTRHFDGLPRTSHRNQEVAVLDVRPVVPGSQGNSFLVGLFCPHPIPIELELHAPHRAVRLGEIGVELECGLGRGPRLPERRRLILQPVARLQRVHLRQCRVRECKALVEFDGLLEVLGRLLHFDGSSHHQTLAFEKEFVGFRVIRGTMRQLGLLLAAQTNAQATHDVLG